VIIIIGLIAAISPEIEVFIKDMLEKKTVKFGSITFITGRLYGCDSVLCICGMGKVNAAIATDTLIHSYHPNCILNIGAAGAISQSLSIGDMIIATAYVQHDIDTSGIIGPPGCIPSINKTHLLCDETLIRHIKKIIQSLPHIKYHCGVIATGDRFICTKSDKKRLYELFDSIACDMEGGAMAQTCYIHNTPFAAMRFISDNADEAATQDFEFNLRKIAHNAQSVVQALFTMLDKGLPTR